MIGLVLVTHGRLAVEFRAALEHVVGPQSQIEAVTIGPEDDVEERRKDIIEAVKRVDSGDGVAILTDMAIRAENIDEAKAEEARKRAESRLAEKLDDEEAAMCAAALAHSLAQLKVKRRQRH